MAIAQSNTRILSDFVGGVALQTAFGTPATPTKFLNMERMSISHNPIDLNFRGTQGTFMKRKDPVKRVVVDPEVILETYVSREMLPTFVECLMGSLPWTSLALTGAISITQGLNRVSGLYLTGMVRGSQTTSQTFYGSFASGGGSLSAHIVFYKEAAKSTVIGSAFCNSTIRTTAITVAVGSFAGTVTFMDGGAYGANTGNLTFTIKYMRYPYAKQNSKYLTVVGWDGTDRYTVQDCAIQRLQLTSRDGEGVLAEITCKGRDIQRTTSTIATSIDDWDFYAHNGELKIYRGTDYSTEIGVTELIVALENNLLSYKANASMSVAQIKRGMTATGTITGQLGDELNVLMRNSLAGPGSLTWDQLQAKWAIGSDSAKFSRFNFGNTKMTGPHQRELTGEENQPDVSFDFESFYDGTRDGVVVELAF